MEFKQIFSGVLSDQVLSVVLGIIVLTITFVLFGLLSYFLLRLIFKVKENIEILKRMGAVFIAFMVFVIAISLKLSIPNVLFKTIELYNPTFYGINIILPAFIGYFTSLYIMRQFNKANKHKDDLLIHRWIIFIFSLALLGSLSIIYEAFRIEQNQSYSLMLVNGIFITALLWNPVFKLKKDFELNDTDDNLFTKKFRTIFNKFAEVKKS